MTILLPFFLSRSYEAQVPVLKVFCSVGYNVIFSLKIKYVTTLLYFTQFSTEVVESSLYIFFQHNTTKFGKQKIPEILILNQYVPFALDNLQGILLELDRLHTVSQDVHSHAVILIDVRGEHLFYCIKVKTPIQFSCQHNGQQ